MINIGAIIYQEVRKRPDLTARKFARMINVSEGHVQKIYKKEHLDTELLVTIAQVLGKPVAYFFNDQTADSEKNLVSEPKSNYKKIELVNCLKELEMTKKELEYLKEINLLLKEKACNKGI